MRKRRKQKTMDTDATVMGVAWYRRDQWDRLLEIKQKTMDTDATVMGVAWYRRDQWDRLLEISSDRAELEDTYDEWKAVAEENMGNLAQHGYKLAKLRSMSRSFSFGAIHRTVLWTEMLGPSLL
jgi:hypothetical protein